MTKLKSFLYGIISASGAAVFQQIFLVIFNINIIEKSLSIPLLIFGALSEEIFKFIFILKISASFVQKPKDLIFKSLFIGFGFSLVELVLKIWNSLENIQLFYLDYLGIMFIHTFTAGIIGYFLTKKNSRFFFAVLSILAAFCLHIIYNLLRLYLF